MEFMAGSGGPCAVVVPVDPDLPVRVIDWPGVDPLATLYEAIGCSVADLCRVGALGLWCDDEGGLVAEPVANARVTWLVTALGELGKLVAGTVVVTLADPDEDGETVGLAGDVARQLAHLAESIPPHDPGELAAAMREMLARRPLVLTLDENGVPHGIHVIRDFREARPSKV